MCCFYKGIKINIITVVLSDRTYKYVKICSSWRLFYSAATADTSMGVVVGKGRRVVVLAACLGTVRVKPCDNPNPLVKDAHKLSHAHNCSQSNSRTTHPLFFSFFSL
ncbi:hypothetical protein V8G54_001011 [Vigna mungo]|uniref:Uncharacterized protein n=1 Tax=Vigna mungo TaxID=3915 RepID=A0AAQ3P7X9_VIGMU